MKKSILYFIVLLFSAFTCGESIDLASSNALILVKTGTSFGMCAGHCITEVEINPLKATMYRKAWRSNIQDKSCERTLIGQEWENLGQTLDFAVFSQLPETIGCPDCADGGQEWIEITYGKQVKRVTFEFGKDIPQMADLISQTRSIRESLKNCE